MEETDLLPTWILTTLDSKLSVEVEWQPGKKWNEKLLSQFYPISLDFAQFRKIAP